MIDHTGLSVADPAVSRRFYEATLAPLGYQALMEVLTEFTGGVMVLGVGVPPKPDFSLHEGQPQTPRLHLLSHVGVTGRSAGHLPAGWGLYFKNRSPGLGWVQAPGNRTS